MSTSSDESNSDTDSESSDSNSDSESGSSSDSGSGNDSSSSKSDSSDDQKENNTKSKSDKSISPMKEISDDELNISSPKFNPMKALCNPHKVVLPSKDAKIYDNISRFIITSSGIVPREPKTPVERKIELETRTSRSRKKPVKKPRVPINEEDIEKMKAKAIGGPRSLLSKYMNENIPVKVITRNARGICGYMLGYIVAFDKHLNLVLKDVVEVWTRRRYPKLLFAGDEKSDVQIVKEFKRINLEERKHEIRKNKSAIENEKSKIKVIDDNVRRSDEFCKRENAEKFRSGQSRNSEDRNKRTREEGKYKCEDRNSKSDVDESFRTLVHSRLSREESPRCRKSRSRHSMEEVEEKDRNSEKRRRDKMTNAEKFRISQSSNSEDRTKRRKEEVKYKSGDRDKSKLDDDKLFRTSVHSRSSGEEFSRCRKSISRYSMEEIRKKDLSSERRRPDKSITWQTRKTDDIHHRKGPDDVYIPRKYSEKRGVSGCREHFKRSNEEASRRGRPTETIGYDLKVKYEGRNRNKYENIRQKAISDERNIKHTLRKDNEIIDKIDERIKTDTNDELRMQIKIDKREKKQNYKTERYIWEDFDKRLENTSLPNAGALYIKPSLYLQPNITVRKKLRKKEICERCMNIIIVKGDQIVLITSASK